MDSRVKCDQCDNEATVHDTSIQQGARVERHLCESCAREAGLIPPSEPPSQTVIPFGPGQIVITSTPIPPSKAPPKNDPKTDPNDPGAPKTPGKKDKVVVVSGGHASPLKVAPCTACGTTYTEFKRTGLMGCEQCYKAFESQLLPLIERAHEGGSFHIGKTPKRLANANPERLALALAEAEARAQRIRDLIRELDAAVASEKYELAAKLRDQLRRMQQDKTSSSPDAPHAS